jgi:lipopolysaccharide export system permease protein
MKLLDRLMIYAYFKSYLVCLVSLLGLWIVVDLFTNLDEFAQRRSVSDILQHVGLYYGPRSAEIFDRLCEPIVLLAAMFTVAWVQRSNELLPQLSAGVSTHRVVTPVLISAGTLLGLSAVNQELIIPRLANYLLSPRDDPEGQRDIPVRGAFEPNGIHISGEKASRDEMVVWEFQCVIGHNLIPGSVLPIRAREAHYIPFQAGQPRTGGWLLSRTHPAELENWTHTDILERLAPGKFFLKTTDVDFDVVTRRDNWYRFISTLRLREELDKPDSPRLAAMAVLFHTRLTRPILGLILVVLGLSVILRDQNRNVFISAGLCLLLCAVFFAACFACQKLGENDYLSPALSAWLPVFVFGPLAFALFDAIHT